MSSVDLQSVALRSGDMNLRFDLSARAGEWLAVIGPSGAGKTTLLNLIAGFDLPASGRVLIGGQDVTRLPPARRPVTTLFQDHNLFAHLTVRANVGLGIDPRLKLDRAGWNAVEAALQQVGLPGLGLRLPAQLSGGERQRVALARALASARPVLLLDEPFAALGPAMRRDMLSLVQLLRNQRSMTILMVTHQVEDSLRGPDRSVLVGGGRIIADGAPSELLARRDLPELSDYLGDRP
jgi:thiamine transport system ATP-binding protein